MGDSPTTTNKTATFADQVLHATIFDVAVKAAEATLEASVPALKLPILEQLEEGVFDLIADAIYQKLALSVTFIIIDAQTSAEAAAANSAADALKTALNGDDANAINQATINFEKSFGSLVHLDGSATP